MDNSPSETKDQPAAGTTSGTLTTRYIPHALSAAIFVISLIATFSLWRNAEHQEKAVLRADFDSQVRQITSSIEERMATYEQVARGVKAFLVSSDVVNRREFHEYVDTLRLQERYPGMQGLAYVKLIPKGQLKQHIAEIQNEGFPNYVVHPVGERSVYSSIIQIEPFTGMNLRAFGYDMLTNPERRAAMERARDTGQAAASRKLKLIQENGKDEQTGLVMYLPVYKQGRPISTIAERRANLIAWIGAPFRMNDLMAGLGGERLKDIILSIYDGNQPSQENLLYRSEEKGVHQQSRAPLFHSQKRTTVAGEPWTIDIASSPYFENRINNGKASVIAVAGFGASAMLALLVWALATGRRRAMLMATSMTQRLKESEFRWKYALEGAGDGVWDWNRQTGEILYSARWKEMLGYSDSELRNDIAEWERLIHPDDKVKALRISSAFLNGKETTYSNEFRMRCKDGSWKWIHARGAAVSRNSKGEVLRAIGTHTDITSRKEAERLDLERTRALNEARDSLRHAQKLEAVGKLTGGVAHDFNNVLQIISGNIQLLQVCNSGDKELESRLASMLSAVERGSKLSSQLLAFARRQPLQPSVLNLGQVVLNMEDLLHRALGETVQLELQASGGLWNTFVDQSQLENVILNLAINARDAMPDGGKLSIALDNVTLHNKPEGMPQEVTQGDYVLLTMNDTGTGMSLEILEQAFEPFFTTKPAGQGTGLGLSMAYGFVKQSGGHIQLHSELGRGTTIKIYLPRSLQTLTERMGESAEPVDGGNETILVVEDDIEVQSTVSSMLKVLGYKVLAAENGDEALTIIKSGAKIDLLLTDVVMPGSLSAPKLASEAKEILPNLAVLFTSGYTRNALVSGGRLDEGVQLLSKPYRREQLAQKVRQILSQQKQLTLG